MVRDNDIFEGAIQVGGIGGNGGGAGGLFGHIPVSAVLYRAADLERGEALLCSLVRSCGNAYIQRTVEAPEHVKLDTFFEGGLNVTLHLEVTGTLKLKSGNVQILLDKTGAIGKAVPTGGQEREKQAVKEEQNAEQTNSPYFALFFGLRKCEQSLLLGDVYSAELRLSEARRELMNMRMRQEGGNVRASFPAYGTLAPAFLEQLKDTYPSAVTEKEIVRSARALLSLYEAYVGNGTAPDDLRLRYLFYREKPIVE